MLREFVLYRRERFKVPPVALTASVPQAFVWMVVVVTRRVRGRASGAI